MPFGGKNVPRDGHFGELDDQKYGLARKCQRILNGSLDFSAGLGTKKRALQNDWVFRTTTAFIIRSFLGGSRFQRLVGMIKLYVSRWRRVQGLLALVSRSALDPAWTDARCLRAIGAGPSIGRPAGPMWSPCRSIGTRCCRTKNSHAYLMRGD